MLLTFGLFLLTCAGTLSAEEMIFLPVRDNTLYEDAEGNVSSGSGNTCLSAGSTAALCVGPGRLRSDRIAVWRSGDSGEPAVQRLQSSARTSGPKTEKGDDGLG